jgi:hypothetical protein
MVHTLVVDESGNRIHAAGNGLYMVFLPPLVILCLFKPFIQ